MPVIFEVATTAMQTIFAVRCDREDDVLHTPQCPANGRQDDLWIRYTASSSSLTIPTTLSHEEATDCEEQSEMMIVLVKHVMKSREKESLLPRRHPLSLSPLARQTQACMHACMHTRRNQRMHSRAVSGEPPQRQGWRSCLWSRTAAPHRPSVRPTCRVGDASQDD